MMSGIVGNLIMGIAFGRVPYLKWKLVVLGFLSWVRRERREECCSYYCIRVEYARHIPFHNNCNNGMNKGKNDG